MIATIVIFHFLFRADGLGQLRTGSVSRTKRSRAPTKAKTRNFSSFKKKKSEINKLLKRLMILIKIQISRFSKFTNKKKETGWATGDWCTSRVLGSGQREIHRQFHAHLTAPLLAFTDLNGLSAGPRARHWLCGRRNRRSTRAQDDRGLRSTALSIKTFPSFHLHRQI